MASLEMEFHPTGHPVTHHGTHLPTGPFVLPSRAQWCSSPARDKWVISKLVAWETELPAEVVCGWKAVEGARGHGVVWLQAAGRP